MKESNSMQEAPLSSIDLQMAPPNSTALFLMSLPSFDAINLLRAFSIVDDVTSSS